MDYNEESIRSKYQLVPRTLVFIQDGDKYLFIHKKKKDSFGFKKLNGIGGHIELGEEPFESARREIKEESGLDINDLSLAALVFIEIGINPGILMFVFHATYTEGQLCGSDEGDLVWIRRGDLENEENIVKDVPFLLEITEKHQPGSPPRIIKYLYDDEKQLRIVY
jgi:8-oxo-dGTP diphosphatase